MPSHFDAKSRAVRDPFALGSPLLVWCNMEHMLLTLVSLRELAWNVFVDVFHNVLFSKSIHWLVLDSIRIPPSRQFPSKAVQSRPALPKQKRKLFKLLIDLSMAPYGCLHTAIRDRGCQRGYSELDRKSTRLNSSH